MTFDETIGINLIEIGKRIAHCTPPLYLSNKGRLEVVSSSILLKWKSNRFLITAGHTLRSHKQSELGLLLNKKFLTIGGYRGNSDSLKIKEDRIDIGFYLLSDEFLEQMGSSYGFFDLESVQIDQEDSTEDDYLIVGYPISRTKIIHVQRKIQLRPFLFKTGLCFESNAYLKTNTKREINLLLNYRRNKILDLLPNNIVKGPELNGLSGSGIWEVAGSLDDISAIKYSPTGIVIEYFKEFQLIVGTRLRIITECLRQAYDNSMPMSKLVKVNVKSGVS